MGKSLKEIDALDAAELLAWRDFFALYGPLDWRREDYRAAAGLQIQTTGGVSLRDLILFPEPETDAARRARTEADALASFGWVDPE